MPTSNRSDFHHLLRSASRTARTAVYGPVRTVVWEGRSREAPPYPDQVLVVDLCTNAVDGGFDVFEVVRPAIDRVRLAGQVDADREGMPVQA